MAEVHIVVHVSDNQIECLLSDASFESAHWCPDVRKLDFDTIVAIVMKGGMVTINHNGTTHIMNLGLIRTGLKILSIINPIQFSNILSDRADANTADLMMQCCILGEIIYG